MSAREDLLPKSLDDDEAWLAYADWLQTAGEPHGELIALDIALERASGAHKQELEAARAELVARHGARMLGDTLARFLADGYASVQWRRGYLVDFGYTGYRLAHKRAVGWLVTLIDETAEPFRFVQNLRFADTDLATLEPFAGFRHLATLDVSNTNVVDIAPLWRLAALARVDLSGCDIERTGLRRFIEERPHVEVRRPTGDLVRAPR